MNELSLFTGAGGGLLGGLLLGWRPIGYVEIDDYCQRLVAARIRDGYLPDAPIFGDIRAFIGEGYAEAYQDVVDVLTAGFPCQPFSIAGRRLADADERNMWPETADTIRLVRPRRAFLENSPGLASSGYLGVVLADLADLGFDAEWDVFSAQACGAPHIRRRLWIAASRRAADADGSDVRLERERDGEQYAQPGAAEPGDDGAPEPAGYAHDQGRQQPGGDHAEGRRRSGDAMPADPLHATSPGLARVSGQRHGFPQRGEAGTTAQRAGRPHGSPGWWSRFPGISGMDDGVAHRLDRIEATGNGQVPAVAARAWEVLNARLQSEAQ